MDERLSEVLVSLFIIGIGVLFFYLAFYVTMLAPRHPRLSVVIPGNATIDAVWSGARYPGGGSANALGLGEYELASPLLVVSGNGSVYRLEPGVTLGVSASLIKPIPFLLFIGILMNYTGIWILVKTFTRRKLPFPSLKILSIVFTATIISSIIFPVWIDLAPGDKAYLEITEASRNGTVVLVHDGMLLSRGRLVAEQAMNIAIMILSIGFGLALLSSGLLILFVKPMSSYSLAESSFSRQRIS